MAKIRQSIRTKLLLSFLVFLIIPAVLGLLVYDYQQERRDLETTISLLQRTQIELQKSFEATREFFNFGQRDTNFFETGESPYLDKRVAAIAAADELLSQMSTNADETIVAVEAFRDDLWEHDADVKVLVGLLRERGLQDYGIVGEMRAIIHTLEDQITHPELQVHMLTLRRHEKDYIIRNQSNYIDALRERAAVFKQDIASFDPLSVPERNMLTELIGRYLAAFNALVEADAVIGVRGGFGKIAELYNTESALVETFAHLERTIAAQVERATSKMTVNLIRSTLVVAVLAIVISFFMSDALTKPLKRLSTSIQRFTDSDFAEPIKLDNATLRNDEIGRIARDFEVLQERMREHVASIRHMAYFDVLTGLASRGYLHQRLGEMISSANRRKDGFALFFVDLDAFKDVNDSLGHEAGDELLIEIGARLKRAGRESDFVARLGGDEFCMLLEDTSDEADVAIVAERCLAMIEEPLTIAGKDFRPQASIGISRYPIDGTDAKALMQAGDNAMYAAKNAGHHRFEFFNRSMTKQAARRLTIAQELRTALAEEQFILLYQPQVSIADGQILSWEALIRWQHPERGMIPPGEFIPEVERLGLINELGNWVIRAACKQLANWRELGSTDMCVSVNIAPRHLGDPRLFDVVMDALDEWDIDPSQLELEVTESGIQSAPNSSEQLARLKATGIRVAIDDFGTGYSSLGSLKHLPIDTLKIDRSFVADMVSNPQDAVLLGTILSLGQALDFTVVAEGVEDDEQLQILQGLDCDLVQGFLFSKPVPSSDVPAIAERGYLEKPGYPGPASRSGTNEE